MNAATAAAAIPYGKNRFMRALKADLPCDFAQGIPSNAEGIKVRTTSSWGIFRVPTISGNT
jgi:hypothetical protein